jgi:hypothetical protein
MGISIAKQIPKTSVLLKKDVVHQWLVIIPVRMQVAINLDEENITMK